MKDWFLAVAAITFSRNIDLRTPANTHRVLTQFFVINFLRMPLMGCGELHD